MATRATRSAARGGRQAAANARARNLAGGPRIRGTQPSAGELNTAARFVARTVAGTTGPTAARRSIQAARRQAGGNAIPLSQRKAVRAAAVAAGIEGPTNPNE